MKRRYFSFAMVAVAALSAWGDRGGKGTAWGKADKPDSLPTFASLQLYAVDGPLNEPIPANAPIDPDSSAYVALIAEVVQEGGFAIELKQFTATVFFADSSTPRVDVRLACGIDWVGVEYLKGVPIPAFAEPTVDVDGSSNPIPFGLCGEDSAQDNQMVILDLENRCEYDMWQVRKEEGQWVASWANSISMDGSGVYEQGFSSRGSGFTTLAGLIWPDELAKGVIEHALIFSYPYPKSGGPVAPASETDGDAFVDQRQYSLPEGARLQLDPTLDLDTLGLTPAEKTISKALQDYGMYLVDFGSTGVSIEAVNPLSVNGNPYDGLLPDVDFPELNNIPLDRLQLLVLGPQDPGADDNNELVDSGCATFSNLAGEGEGEGEGEGPGCSASIPLSGRGLTWNDGALFVLLASLLLLASRRQRRS